MIYIYIYIYRMMYFGICIDLEIRYRLHSVLCTDQCTLQRCVRFLLATHETVHAAYLQCMVPVCTRIYAKALYWLMIKQCTLLFTAYTIENTVSDWLTLLSVYSNKILV